MQKLVVAGIGTALITPVVMSAETIVDATAHYEAVISAALVISEGDLLSFGFNVFDPNKILGTDNPNLGGADSIEAADRISSISLPTTFYVGDEEGLWLHRVKLRAAWMGLNREINYSILDVPAVEEWPNDYSDDSVLAGYAEYALGYNFAPRWHVYGGTGVHLMYYQNVFDANSPLISEVEKVGLDTYANTDTFAWVVEPQIDFNYTYEYPLAEFQFNSQYHYFYGQNFGGSGGQYRATPESWTISNSVQLKHHLPTIFEHKQNILWRFRRIDLGGDLRQPLGATHYNEYSVGWIIDTSRYSSLIYNVGLGININYGSSLNGGSIVFFYNE
jgi:hypothetical protein